MSKSGALHDLEPSPSDAISSIAFSSTSTRLLASSWDGHLYIYTRRQDGADTPFTLLRTLNVEAPVLSACWGSTDDTIFASTLEGEVLQYDLATPPEQEAETDQQQPQHDPHVLSEHTQGANKLAFSHPHNILLSTSWDSTLHVHSPSTHEHSRLQLAAKPFALSLSPTRAVVAMAERKVSVYVLDDLQKILSQSSSTSASQDALGAKPREQRTSNLKFMARDLACHPDGSGFATSSIEGRVSVEYFDGERDQEKYAFKCHRQTSTRESADAEAEAEKVDIVYPVNALAFHPTFGTFATGGGDGAVAIWDANSKRRVKQYKELGASVAALDFSGDGKFLAVGVCPGFEDGMEAEEVRPEECRIVVRQLTENEAKGGAKKSKG